jgi:TetR/AcrR family transcriptional regulator
MPGNAVRNPIQERSQITRERLLEAAIRCFASTGYDASSTRHIESSAGVKRGLIGYHFGTKEALWKAAATWMFERAAQELQSTERSAANIDPVARLRYFVRAFVHFNARFPEVNQLMVREGMDNDWRLEWLVENTVRPWYERVRELFEDARSLGLGPAIGYLHFYYILTGAAALIFSMAPEAKRLAGVDPRTDPIVNAHADALADLLFPESPQLTDLTDQE